MATTPGAIRNRMVALITAIVPALHAAQRFAQYREQSPLADHAEQNPSACLRRFSVRSGGDTSQSLVTDHVVERVEESIVVQVTYPLDWRHNGASPGGVQLLGLDDLIASDAKQIEAAIGVPSADSTLKLLATIFRPGEVERETAGPVVILTIRYRVEYARSLA